MASTATAAPPRAGARVHVQKFGTFLSNMIMPNIGAIIAWGCSPRFHPDGLDCPTTKIATPGRPDDLLPAADPDRLHRRPDRLRRPRRRRRCLRRHGRDHGRPCDRAVHRLARADAVADVPRRDDHGSARGLDDEAARRPVGRQDQGRASRCSSTTSRPASAAVVMAIVGFVRRSPRSSTRSPSWLGNASNCLVDNSLLPLTSIFIEPAKVLFLNNAINHGVLTPLGIQEAAEQGKSVLFLLEANPGPGLGLLLAYTFFGKGLAKASAPGALVIQFFGGIHEIYFPYVLMKPKLILAMILGGMTGVAINVLFDVGPARPGGAGLDLRGVRADAERRLPRRHAGRSSAPRRSRSRSASFLLKLDKVDGRGRPAGRHRGHGGDEGQEVLGRRRPDRRGRRHRRRSGRSCSPATPAWAPRPWAPRCCARRSRRAGHGEVTVVNKAISNLTTPTTWSSPTRT